MKQEEIPNQKASSTGLNPKYFPNAYWASKNSDSKRLSKKYAAPRKRWGHSGVFYENSLFVFGGSSSGAKATKTTDYVYVLNCESFEWEKIPMPQDQVAGTNIPEVRDSHGCVVLGNSMIIYGGSTSDKTFDDIWSFSFQTKLWSKIIPEKNSEIPCKREGHSCCVISDRYIYIYGGWDGDNLLDDSYLFDTKTKSWQKVVKAPGDDPGERDSQTCSLIKDSMYLFGGQGNAKKKMDTYFNDIYRMKLSITPTKVVSYCEKIIPRDPNIVPSYRTSHSASVYKDRFIFIIGGEGYENDFPTEMELEEEEPVDEKGEGNKNNKGENAAGEENEEDEDHKCFPKSDVWIYDCELNIWSQLFARNTECFVPRFAHSSCVYKDSIIIFGGLKDYLNSTDDLIVLYLEEDMTLKKKSSDLCNVCKRYYIKEEPADAESEEGLPKEKQIPANKEQKEQKEQPIVEVPSNRLAIPNTMISVSYLSSIANLTSWPFSAIGLLVDNAFSRDANEMRINLYEEPRILFNSEPAQPQVNIIEAAAASNQNANSANARADASSLEIKEEKVEAIKLIPDSALAEKNDLNKTMEEIIEAGSSPNNALISQKIEATTNSNQNPVVQAPSVSVTGAQSSNSSNVLQQPAASSSVQINQSPVSIPPTNINSNVNNNAAQSNTSSNASGGVAVNTNATVSNNNNNNNSNNNNASNVNSNPPNAQKKGDASEKVCYLLIQDKGKPWDPQDFLQMFFYFRHSDNEGETSHHAEYGNFLKLGALRLGETALFISRTDKKVSMGFLSSNKRYNAHFNEYMIFFAAYDIEHNQPLTEYYHQSKKNIYDSVRHFLKEKDLIPDNPGNYLYITDLKRAIFRNSLGYELTPIPGADIMYQTTLKLKAHEEITNARLNLIDYSLRKFLSFLFLKPPKVFKVYLQNREVVFMDYEEKLNNQKNQGIIKEINVDELKECGEVRLFVTSRYIEQKLNSREEKPPREVKKQAAPIIETPLYNEGTNPPMGFSHNSLGPINKPMHYQHRPWPYPAHHDQPKFSSLGNTFSPFYGRGMMMNSQNSYRRPVDGSNSIIVLDEENEDKNVNGREDGRRQSEKKEDQDRREEVMSEEKAKRQSEFKRSDSKGERPPEKLNFPEMHQGILIYSKQRLVTRYETKRLGELDIYLNKRFGKSKNTDAFDTLGFIELSNFMDREINILKNEITNSLHSSILSYMIDQCLKTNIQNLKIEKTMKYKTDENLGDETRKMLKTK